MELILRAVGPCGLTARPLYEPCSFGIGIRADRLNVVSQRRLDRQISVLSGLARGYTIAAKRKNTTNDEHSRRGCNHHGAENKVPRICVDEGDNSQRAKRQGTDAFENCLSR